MFSQWTTEAALAELRGLADGTAELEQIGEGNQSENHNRWRLRVESVLEEVFGPQNRYSSEFRAIHWSGPNAVYMGTRTLAYPDELRRARGVLAAAADELERRAPKADTMGSHAPETSIVTRIISIAQRKL